MISLAQVLEWKYGPVAGIASIISVVYDDIDVLLKVPYEFKEVQGKIETDVSIDSETKTVIFMIGIKEFIVNISDVTGLDKIGKIITLKKSIADNNGIPYTEDNEDKDNKIFKIQGKNYIVPLSDVFGLNETNKTLKIKQIEADKYKIPYDLEAFEMIITSWKHPDDVKQPTKTQIQADTIEYQTHIDSIAYKEVRRVEYPDIGDQLDSIWKVFSTLDLTAIPEAETMLAAINEIKNKHPKP